MTMDYKKVDFDQFEDFLKRETRYSALYKANPDVDNKTIRKNPFRCRKNALKRYATMAGLDLEKIWKKKRSN